MNCLKSLRRQSILRTMMPLIILWGAAAALFLIFSGPAALRSLAPKTLAELTPETMEGAFVEDEIPFIYAQFVEEEQYRDNVPTGKITGGEFLIDFDSMCYMAMFAHADTLNEANALMEASWSVMDGEADLDSLPMMHVKGTIVAMDDEERTYYYELAEGDSELEAVMLPYYINVNRIGTTPIIMAYILLALAAALAIWGLCLLIRALSGGGQKKLRAKLDAIGGGDALLERFDRFYEETQPVNGVRLSTDFVLFYNGNESVLLLPKEIAWAYQSTTQHRTNGIPTGKTYCLVLHTMDGKKYELSMSEKHVQELLEAIHEQLPGTVVGYDDEINRRYKQDRDAFRARWEEARPGSYPLTESQGRE